MISSPGFVFIRFYKIPFRSIQIPFVNCPFGPINWARWQVFDLFHSGRFCLVGPHHERAQFFRGGMGMMGEMRREWTEWTMGKMDDIEAMENKWIRMIKPWIYHDKTMIKPYKTWLLWVEHEQTSTSSLEVPGAALKGDLDRQMSTFNMNEG